MGKLRSVGILLGGMAVFIFHSGIVQAQCTSGDIMDPGFQFLTNSRGCAPFNVQMQTNYLNSTPGTTYYIDWGDGSPIETYVQATTSGVVLQHSYPNSPVDCGYNVIIDAENTCNPRGSVTPIETEVLVWTNDVISINPQVFRICEGFAQELQFSDDSDWNCFPRDTRENEEARWIQWIYGTGDPSIRIPGITIDGAAPGTFPHLNPDPNYDPLYPVITQGQTTLPISVPATALIGEEFEVTLRNWNQCNPYDNDVKDGDGRNPVSGDVANGDNDPVTTTARIVVVPAPEPEFQTRSGNSSGELATTFCIGEDIYFENLTPSIAGSAFAYSWEFFDNATGTGSPIHTSNDQDPIYSFTEPGTKLIRLRVKDNNAAGDCETFIEHQVSISPLLQAQIGITDTDDNPITPEFCQNTDGSLIFTVRFTDESVGTVTSDTRWRWEFYDENGVLFQSEPSGTGFSSTPLEPFDIDYNREGDYKIKLTIVDDATDCYSEDIKTVKVNLNPTADFTVQNVCMGDSVTIEDTSFTSGGESIIGWSYDILNDNTTDTAFSTSQSWKYYFSQPGEYPVKLTVVSETGCVDSLVKVISVDPLPESEISADQLIGCSELEVVLQNLVWDQTIPVDYYQWEVNSGNGFEIDSVQSPNDNSFNSTYTRYFINEGSEDKVYQVRMLAVGENGCSSISETLEITVTPGATSGFLYTNYSPFNNNCSPQDIHFQVDAETQALSPTNYSWEIFIEDSLVHQENSGATPGFDHIFTNNTNSVLEYGIKMTTTLDQSCSADSLLFVRINPIPSADFEIDTLSLDCESVTLRFNSIQKGLPYYRWKLEAEGVPIYSHEGVSDYFDYTFDRGASEIGLAISFNTRNLVNCLSEEVIKNAVVSAKDDFTAAFTIPQNDVQLPDATVQVTDQSTPGDWEYLWDFGNGETSDDPELSSYTYTSVGEYLLTLTISDGICQKSYSELVRVTSPSPTAEFEFEGSGGCLPHTVVFENLSNYGGDFLWDFGDGNTSTEESPVYTYTAPGIYSVRLTVTGLNGEETNIYKQDIIEVYERPSAYFEVRPSLVYVPDMPVYTRNLSTGATSYFWDFGDGTVSTDFEPSHTYQEAGQYDITLEAYNQFCYDSLTLEGAVNAKIAGRVLVPNAFSPNRSGGGSNGFGENDVFVPLLADVSTYKLQIFNRWGEMLYEGKDQGWDGYYKGNLCAQDVYVYRIEVVFNNGEETIMVGDVNLIR